MATLRDKTISGMFWSLLQNVGGKGIMFVVMIILARLLTPEIFGLVGMLTIFIQVSQVLTIAGFNQALIQKKETDTEDYSSVFWVNLLVSVFIYVIVFFAAPFIAKFYSQPILIELTRVLALVFVINAFSYVQEAKLSKEMRFKTLAIINIPSTIFGAVVSIIMAVLGYGVWSLIALQLTTKLAYAIQIWIYSKWVPLLIVNRERTSRLFSFGSNLLVSNLIHTIYTNMYTAIIGKFFPLSMVGYYQNANNLVQYPASAFNTALNKVAFPAFSSIQNDNKRLREGFKKIIQQVLFWLCPAFMFSAVLAVPLFNVVFTEKWIEAVPFFRILCVVGIFIPLNIYNLNIVKVKGHSNLVLRLEIFKKAFSIVGIFLMIPLGIWALLIFQAINSLVMFIFNSYYSGRFVQYSVIDQLKDITPIFALSASVSVLLYFIDQSILALSDYIRLFIGAAVGVISYFLLAKYFGVSAYKVFVEIYKEKFLSRVRTSVGR